MLNDGKDQEEEHEAGSLKDRLWRIIFLTDTKAGRMFDVVLLWLIGISVMVTMFETVQSYREWNPEFFLILEWFFTIVFTIEYLVRIWVVKKKGSYIFSFFGIVDLLSIIPTYLTLIPSADEGTRALIVVRIFRLLRVFRVLKMVRHLGEANILLNALRSSWAKITVFVFCVVAVAVVLGTIMFVIEGPIFDVNNPGFSSVPQSVYWAIVTISTVGYGDVAPLTPLGKLVASFLMLIGYGIIAVPTGIVTAELNMELSSTIHLDHRKCEECGTVGHDQRAVYCKMCGTNL